MAYRAPVGEFRFLFDHVVGYREVVATDRFAEAAGDTTDAVLNGAARFCEEVLAPCAAGRPASRRCSRTASCGPAGLRRGAPGDGRGRLDGDLGARGHGGLGLPQTLATALNEMMSGLPT
jgi:acyl-CoA dehydrogenase